MKMTELLTQYGIKYKLAGEHHHVTKDWIGIDCPYCDGAGSEKYHLGIRGRSAVCWRCGKLNLVKALAALTGFPYGKVLSDLGTVQPQRTPDKRETPGKLKLPPDIGPLQQPHKRYLKERGFNVELVERLWGVRGIGELGGCYSWSLFVPVYWNGKLVSWTTRSIGKKRRWLTAPIQSQAIPIKELLYGEDLAGSSIVVVEGPTDCWQIGPGAVGIFGLSWTDRQVARIGRFPRRLICFDNEPQAQRKAKQLAGLLAMFDGTTKILKLESGKDPAEADEREITEIRSMLE